MEASAVTAALAHRRVKRSLGLVRKLAREVADLLDDDVDLIGEVALDAGAPLDEVHELLAHARRGRASVTIVVIATPGERPRRCSCGAGAGPRALGEHDAACPMRGVNDR